MNLAREYYIRTAPKSAARADPVYHSADCPKLAQRNLKRDSYRQVDRPPEGYRPCKRCGG